MTKGNLLIIDDETLLLEKTSLLLEDIADNVYTACSGIDGIEIFNSQNIHCIICDINMPNMNGVEVLENIRKINQTVPFIFYTGHGSRELMKAAVKLGAFDFIDKPNLDGLEEITINGLKLGFKEGINHQDLSNSTNFISEYKKLLSLTNS